MRLLLPYISLILLGATLLGCQPAHLTSLSEVPVETSALSTPVPVPAEPTNSSKPDSESDGSEGSLVTPTLTVEPTIESTAAPEPSPTSPPTPTPVPTATPIGPCSERLPQDNLLEVVTLTYSLSKEYAPDDLVPLADVFPMQVTLGYPSEIREVAIEPLQAMVADMQDEGVQPRIMSAYRSYAAQAIAWAKWNDLYPEHAHIISAPPGHSEHQLGTVVDFGSPELAGIVGEPDIEFHTLFYKTSEGQWLIENAHRYGFTLSYPGKAFEVTGFYYEPWHYRYVGETMATFLHENGTSLTEHQLSNEAEPCIP